MRLPLRDPVSPAQEPVTGPVARSPRLGSLTGLRFFAAIPVVICHLGDQFTHSDKLLIAEYYGYIGVSFFFLLSGFVLTWSCAGQGAGRFWWMRFSRVWPLQFVLAVFAFSVVADRENIPGPRGRALDVLLVQAWSPAQRTYFGGNGVSWSLSAEMFFYLLFPLLIIPLLRLRGRGLAVTAAVTVAVMTAVPLIARHDGMSDAHFYWLFFVFPPYRLGEFLLGMVLARAVALGLRLPVPGLMGVAALVGLTGVVWGITRYTIDVGKYAERPFVALAVIPLFMLLLLAGATVDVTRGRGWLSSRPMLRLGEWSFALYLVHEPIFFLAQKWGWWAGHPTGLRALALFVAFLGFATLGAAVLHYTIEKPVEKWLRGLVTTLRRPVAVG